MNISEEQSKKIQEIGQRYGLKLILLHGSHVTNRAHKDSDVDIAVLGKETISWEHQRSLFGDFGAVFPGLELDVKFLHHKDPLFRYYVSRDSRLLYGSPGDYNDFRAHAFAQYHDSKDLRKLEAHLVDRYQMQLNEKYALV